MGARNPYQSEAVRSHEVPLVFGLSMRKILTIFGALMMLFVVVNVQFGSVAPRVIDGAEGYKLDAFYAKMVL